MAKSVKGFGLESFNFITVLTETNTGYEDRSTLFSGFALYFSSGPQKTKCEGEYVTTIVENKM